MCDCGGTWCAGGVLQPSELEADMCGDEGSHHPVDAGAVRTQQPPHTHVRM